MGLTPTNLPGGIRGDGYLALGSLVNTTGKVWFVGSAESNAQDDPSHGKSPDRPYATLEYANTRLEAAARGSKGDVVIVMPGHTEAVISAAAVNCDVAGVSYLGLGRGSDRPTFTMSTVVGASFRVSAANVLISNFLFAGGIDALTGAVQIQAADCSLLSIETRDVTGQATDFIVTTAAADRLRISGWTHRGASAAGADTALSIVGGDGSVIEDFWIDGQFAVGCIENVTTSATNITIGGGSKGANYLRTRNAADILIVLTATATGNIGPNIYGRVVDNAANFDAAFSGATMQYFAPILLVNLDNEQGGDAGGVASTNA